MGKCPAWPRIGRDASRDRQAEGLVRILPAVYDEPNNELVDPLSCGPIATW